MAGKGKVTEERRNEWKKQVTLIDKLFKEGRLKFKSSKEYEFFYGSVFDGRPGIKYWIEIGIDISMYQSKWLRDIFNRIE